MAVQFFKACNFQRASLALIEQCNTVIDTYATAGYRLTLRQLYYQLVSANIIRNEEKSYKNLGSIVSKGRLAGLIDWDSIEDRVRTPDEPPEWESIEDLVDGALHAYRLPRWEGQDYYAELWVEKDALAGVLRPLARQFHVTLMVNRGYSSQSAMYESAGRFHAAYDRDQSCVLFYLGDHDPSGEDMVRDIDDRLAMFGCTVDVQKIALTTAQVRQYNPPPNPAKFSDPRASEYVRLHGRYSWEVDALPPPVLSQIITDAFSNVIDFDAMEAVKEREREDKELLTAAVQNLRSA